MMTSKEVTRIIVENKKRFECPEFLFADDSGLSSYNNEKLRVLVLFLSNGRYRSSSNTFNVLNDCLRKLGVFSDYCYFPHPDDISLYDELGIPYIRGARSGFLVDDFDIILVSIAVLKEAVNLPVVLMHDGIPLGINGRNERNYPIIAMGGSSAHVLSILCGDFILNGTRDRSLVDLVNFGKCENSFRDLIQECSKYDSVRSHREEILENISNRWLNPAKLRFEYNSDGYIIRESSGQKVIFDAGQDVTENFNHKILNVDGSFSDRTDVLISYGCNGRGYCSFCLEGATGGCWKEKSISNIESDIIESKKNSWSEACGIFSYNANYHSQIEDIAKLLKVYFNRSSVLMSRADIYAKNTKYIDICKGMGTLKMSIAAEGMSDSIRNDFLNKRLSRKDLHDSVHNLLDSRMIMTLKINYILTGREKSSDFQEWIDDIRDMIEYKKSNSISTRLSVTITNLVIYDMTPLRYEPRIMAKESLNYKESIFIEEFLSYVKQISAMGVGVNLYGSGMVSAFEQLILDLGYMGTSILVNSCARDGLRYDRDITKSMCEKFFKRVQSTYDINTLFMERDKDAWFPSDLILWNNRKRGKGTQTSYKDTSCEQCINLSTD